MNSKEDSLSKDDRTVGNILKEEYISEKKNADHFGDKSQN